MMRENSLVKFLAESVSTERNVKVTMMPRSQHTTTAFSGSRITLKPNFRWPDYTKASVIMIFVKHTATEFWRLMPQMSRLPSWLQTYYWWKMRLRLRSKLTSSCLKSHQITSTPSPSWLSCSGELAAWMNSKSILMTPKKSVVGATWLVLHSVKVSITTISTSLPTPSRSSTSPDKTVFLVH